MSTALSRTLQRMLALTLLIALAVGFYAVAIAPVVAHVNETRLAIEHERRTLGRFEALARDDATNDPSTDSARASQQAIFLAGSNDAIRLANLQARISDLAAAANIEITSTREIAPEVRDGVALLGVESAMKATHRDVQTLLAAIEAGTPPLFVRSIKLSPSPLAGGADGDGDTANTLDATLHIVGAVERAIDGTDINGENTGDSDTNAPDNRGRAE